MVHMAIIKAATYELLIMGDTGFEPVTSTMST